MAQSTPPAVFVLPWIPPPMEALARATRAGGGRTRHVAGDTISRRRQRCYHQQRWQKHARAQPGRHGTCATQSALSGSGQPGRMATCTWCASVASRTLGHRRAALHTGARPRHMYMPAPLQPDLPPRAPHREDRSIHPIAQLGRRARLPATPTSPSHNRVSLPGCCVRVSCADATHGCGAPCHRGWIHHIALSALCVALCARLGTQIRSRLNPRRSLSPRCAAPRRSDVNTSQPPGRSTGAPSSPAPSQNRGLLHRMCVAPRLTGGRWYEAAGWAGPQYLFLDVGKAKRPTLFNALASTSPCSGRK